MRTAPLIVLLLIVGCAEKARPPSLVETRPAQPLSSEHDRTPREPDGATDIDLSAPTPAPDASVPRGDFAKGTRFANVYGSTIFGDAGKGEMYLLHAGVGTHVADYQSISLDLFGGYVRSGIDDNGAAVGLDAVYRNHFLRGGGGDGDDWTVFFEGGLGLQEASTNFAGERHFNFRTRLGFGASFEINQHVRAFVGGTYQHISDAGIKGGGGGFDGPMLWAGITFPF